MNKFFFITFLLSSLFLYGQHNDVTFEKSKKIYRAKSIKYTYYNFFTENEYTNRGYYPSKVTMEEAHEFPINFKKRAKRVDGIDLYPIIFGKKKAESYGITIDNKYYEWGKRLDYLSFSGDSIFYNDYSYDENNLVRKLLCVLDENWKDTSYIHSFGEMNRHKLSYSNSFYYTPINDTVYNFELKYIPWSQKAYVHNDKKRSANKTFYTTYVFSYIGISKRYGFVWIKYSFKNNEYEVYYY